MYRSSSVMLLLKWQSKLWPIFAKERSLSNQCFSVFHNFWLTNISLLFSADFQANLNWKKKNIKTLCNLITIFWEMVLIIIFFKRKSILKWFDRFFVKKCENSYCTCFEYLPFFFHAKNHVQKITCLTYFTNFFTRFYGPLARFSRMYFALLSSPYFDLRNGLETIKKPFW